ncbi:MAG: c-type cytochrome [Cellvibrio sp.]|nr:c-type cytochrome [Cellvibrio sp.]
MSTQFNKFLFGCLFFLSAQISLAQETPFWQFQENISWVTTETASVANKNLLLADKPGNIIAIKDWQSAKPLVARAYIGDAILEMDFLLAESSSATVFLEGRYAIELKDNTSEWQRLQVKYRVPRFDDARNKTENAMILELVINGEQTSYNKIVDAVSPGALMHWEDAAGPLAIKANGVFALRNVKFLPADFSNIKLPEKSGEPSNEQTLIDFVELGKETFDSVGCNACHLIEKNSAGASTGPNLYGLFKREPRNRQVVEGGEGHKVTIKANRPYLHMSLREPAEQIAIRESGEKIGEAYLPIMPAFTKDTLSDIQIDAIGDYLATLNEPWDQGRLSNYSRLKAINLMILLLIVCNY